MQKRLKLHIHWGSTCLYSYRRVNHPGLSLTKNVGVGGYISPRAPGFHNDT